MHAPLSRASRLLCATTLALALLAAPAYAADTPFTPRFAQTVPGDIAAVGNTVMTCPASAACTTAQDRTGVGAALNNNSYTMGRVDIDADATTFDSSSATVSIPAGSTVLWAGLYWAADTSAGTGGAAAQTASSRGTVQLKVPGGAYQSVSASAGDVLQSTATRYRAFRDVTALLPAAGTRSRTSRPARAPTASPAGRCSSPIAMRRSRSGA
ncbi:MAG: hypothetical protein ACXWZZ_13305 [Solirubrobacteraceae bacterium]